MTIIIYPKSRQGHIEYIENVLQIIEEGGFYFLKFKDGVNWRYNKFDWYKIEVFQ